MKKILLGFIAIGLLFVSCNQSEIERLEDKIKELQYENSNLNRLLNEERLEKQQLEKKLQKPKEVNYSDNYIANLVRKEAEFNCPNYYLKNFIVKKENTNRYKVRFSVKSKTRKYAEWGSVFYEVIFYPETSEYTALFKRGEVCLD